ncbi:MAG: clan AA aspartic protease [Acidobacteria bacterium]|nr:MAG: clan AA aspartic protease [Acidobacteriota bacterium]
MGEARVQVKLLNAIDEGMARRGLLPVDQVRTYEANALVDSGAVSSVLPVEVTRRLGLEVVDRRVDQYANGSQEVVDVTEPVAIVINNRKTVEQTLVIGDEVLIGQTVLETLDLLVDCANGRVITNPAHPDQTVNKVK